MKRLTKKDLMAGLLLEYCSQIKDTNNIEREKIAKEIEVRKKEIAIQEKELATKDRVNISLQEYNEMKETIKGLETYRDAMITLIKTITSKTSDADWELIYNKLSKGEFDIFYVDDPICSTRKYGISFKIDLFKVY